MKNFIIMKTLKGLLVALFMLCTTAGYAQEAIKYQGEVDLGYSIGVGTFNINRANLHTIHGAKINKNFSVGLGIGLDLYHNEGDLDFMLPIFVNAKGYLPINEKFSPYASLDLGYGIGVSESFSGVGGFYWSPAIGIKYDKFKFQIGYVSQSLSESGFSINMEAVQFKLGLAF